jgi:hypothetical protein
MPLLITSAAGKNGNGFGALLAFDLGGSLLGNFTDDSRIADPRGLAVNWGEELLFLNVARIESWRSTRLAGSFVTPARLKGWMPVAAISVLMADITSGCVAPAR